MREILFRGKRIDTGEWVEGSLLIAIDYLTDKLLHIIASNPTAFPHSEVSGCDSVDPNTVGQYAGLKDKNGKRIFEGDICRVCLDPEICISRIQNDQRIAAFVMRHNENECSTFLDMWFAKRRVGDRVWIEVIGNVHDNPELVNAEEVANE